MEGAKVRGLSARAKLDRNLPGLIISSSSGTSDCTLSAKLRVSNPDVNNFFDFSFEIQSWSHTKP
jgi:hypothetical protein